MGSICGAWFIHHGIAQLASVNTDWSLAPVSRSAMVERPCETRFMTVTGILTTCTFGLSCTIMCGIVHQRQLTEAYAGHFV